MPNTTPSTFLQTRSVLRFTDPDLSGLPAAGSIFFVSSVTGSSTGGYTADAPAATIAQALALCTDSKNDTIFLLPGHNEGIANAQLTWNKIGVNIIGLGTGSLRPRIDFDHANASIDITASGMTIRNLTLLPSVTGVVIGIDVNTLVTDTTFEDIEILPGEDGAGVDEFVLAFDLKVGCNRTKFRRIKHRQHASAAGSVASISLTGASDDVSFVDCFFDMAGAALVAPINAITTLSTGLLFRNCIFVTDAAEPGYELITGSTGVAIDCLVFSNMANLADALVGDGVARFRCENIEVAAESGGVIGTASADD